MNQQQLLHAVETALSDRTPSETQVTIAIGAAAAVLDVEKADSLSGAFHAAEYRVSQPENRSKNVVNKQGDPMSGDQLRRFADSLSNRLTYLMEPISTIEADPQIVQLRSDPPLVEEKQTRFYFELLAMPGRCRLVRYRKSTGEPRRVVAMHLTYEVVARLLLDIDNAYQTA